jgi:tRNA (cytidine32/uridine32-2'-O)-methyltransferase
MCQIHVHIPTNEEYASLNVASAVQVLAYEMRMGILSHQGELDAQYEGDWGVTWDNELANQGEINGFIAHLEQTLVDIEFLDPTNPKQLMPRLRRLFQRAMPDKVEINILRGILKMVSRSRDK